MNDTAMDKDVYFSLGANIGNRRQNIEDAIGMMDSAFGGKYLRLSSFVETDPWEFESEDKFLNCAVVYSLDLPCRQILQICNDIESRLGRECHAPEYDADGKRIYRSRLIDIDILFYGFERINEPGLIVPHHRMKERDFVMVPLREIADEGLVSEFADIFY